MQLLRYLVGGEGGSLPGWLEVGLGIVFFLFFLLGIVAIVKLDKGDQALNWTVPGCQSHMLKENPCMLYGIYALGLSINYRQIKENIFTNQFISWH